MNRGSSQQPPKSALYSLLAAFCLILPGCTGSASLDALATENAKIKAENDLLRTENQKLTAELDRTKEGLANATTAIAQRGQRDVCVKNMRRISGAVDHWVLANNKAITDQPSASDLSEYIKLATVVCPGGGQCSLGTAETPPACTVHGGLASAR